jgi:membrane-associated phospholipid phosphatase
MKNAVRASLFSLVFLWGSSFAQTVRGAYDLTWQRDIPLAVGSVGSFAFGQWRIMNMDAYDGRYDKNDLMPWDRPFAGRWNAKADLASDILTGAGAFPLVLSVSDWSRGRLGGSDVAVQLAMLSEVLALQSGINLAVRSLAVWPRPFLLGSKGGTERNSKDASGSFYSGHSSAAFSIAVFSSCWYDRTHPGSRYSPWIWGGSLAVAATTASLRVIAGKHYPSDILVGALVGSLVGWAVPRMHQAQPAIQPPLSQAQMTMAPLPGGAMFQIVF